MTVRADDNLSLQARDVIKLRLNTGSCLERILFVESGALLLNGHDIDIIPKMYCLVRDLRAGSVDSMDGGGPTLYHISTLHTTNGFVS
jgi:hypothetical protein